jgi:hypothetical protein
MKIKRFNSFINENTSFVDGYEDDDIKKTIKDIFVDLEDIDINCDVSINDSDMDEPNVLRVSLSSENSTILNTNIFNDSIPMFLDYLDEIKPDLEDFYEINYSYYDQTSKEIKFQKELPNNIEVTWLVIMVDIIDLDWIKRTGRDEN